MRNLRLAGCIALVMPSAALAAGGGSSGYISDAPIPWHMHETADGQNAIELIDHAKQRIGLETATVLGPQGSPGTAVDLSIPYQSLIYWADGTTWVYAVNGDGYYVRMPVEVDFIEDDYVALTSGPGIGTTIVTFGAAELFGAETGTGH